jgi:nicotinate-nucleotide adenylyltransferase
MQSIALFGGAFDPVHNGHLQTSLRIQDHFHFDSYRFLPCKTPSIKSATIANSLQRTEMLRRAIQPYPQFTLDLREINRETPSYMVHTLESLRSEHKRDSLTLIIGYDAFLSLPQWYQWEQIIKCANLMVINRNQFSEVPMPDLIQRFLLKHQCTQKQELLSTQSRLIYLFNAGDYPISSTEIRNQLKNNEDIEGKVPTEVYQYIKTQGLYR